MISPQLAITLMCLCLGANIGFGLLLAVIVMKRVRTATTKCMEENHKEREAIAKEYKNLAEKATNALVNLGTLLADINQRIPRNGTTTFVNNPALTPQSQPGA